MPLRAGRPSNFEDYRPLMEHMADLIEQQPELQPSKAARRIAKGPFAIRKRKNLQQDSIRRELLRHWKEHGAEIQREREALRSDAPLVCTEKALWDAIRRDPHAVTQTDVLKDIVAAAIAKRHLINDPLLDAIAALLDRASSEEAPGLAGWAWDGH
jgi:hypothetical protein